MSWKHTFLVVTGCALAGMVLGGLFGFASGNIAPDLFHSLIPWKTVEPVGAATFLGATAGVLLGGGLGCFGIAIELVLKFKNRDPID